MSIKRSNSDLSTAIFYADYVPYKRDSTTSSISGISHTNTQITTFVQPPPNAIIIDRHPNSIREFIELQSLPPLLSTPQQSERPPILRLDPDSIDVNITWCRQHLNDRGTALLTQSSKPIGLGSSIFCRKKYGNGRIVQMSRRYGRYTHFLVQFQNDEHGILTRDIAVPFSLVDHTIHGRIISLVSFITHPFVYYHQCLP
jgi:hypothetical protein